MAVVSPLAASGAAVEVAAGDSSEVLRLNGLFRLESLLVCLFYDFLKSDYDLSLVDVALLRLVVLYHLQALSVFGCSQRNLHSGRFLNSGFSLSIWSSKLFS